MSDTIIPFICFFVATIGVGIFRCADFGWRTFYLQKGRYLMKKLTVLLLFTIVISLASCNINGALGSIETKEIVLGDEVTSLVLTTVNGEQITCDGEADFYELFNNFELYCKVGEKYSCSAEMKLGDNSKSFNTLNIYYLPNSTLFEATVKKEGDDDVAVIEDYSYSNTLSVNTFERTDFVNYSYKDEKAFGGIVIDANGSTVYASEEYPMQPTVGTELHDMQARAGYLKYIANVPSFFHDFEPYEADGKTYDLNDFITREYKLYENYIVFKQTAPFMYVNISSGYDVAAMYESFSNAECSITQEVYCNVKTGKIEFIKVYGDTLWHLPQYFGQKMEIDLQLYIQDNSQTEGQQKVDKLIEHIKKNVE